MIRDITRSDIPECVNVIRASFQTVADEFGFNAENAPRFTAFAMTEERLNWQLDNEHRKMFACCVNDKIIGYYSLLLQQNNECELNNLCVLPDYRHRGIGKKLLENAFEVAKSLNCVKMNIGIVEENTRLRKWYESFGFKHTGTKKFDFFPFTCGYLSVNLLDK
jgi:ribosomal protein S18 acetylase RimI-like enzyme